MIYKYIIYFIYYIKYICFCVLYHIIIYILININYITNHVIIKTSRRWLEKDLNYPNIINKINIIKCSKIIYKK